MISCKPTMQLFYIVLAGFVVYYRRFHPANMFMGKHILPGTGNKRP